MTIAPKTAEGALSASASALSATTPALPFSYRERFRGKNVVIIGGTGFLGKVWWSFLLHRCPDLGQLYLVVRSRPGLSSEARFWKDIASSGSMEALREQHGDDLEAFFRSKITVLDGDITQPFCGIAESFRAQLRGGVDAVVNASGIVDFQPPLDVALEVNAFGAQSLVALARDLGNVPVMHTSTCYVAGYKTGIVEESNPLEHPFPFAGSLERAHWEPDREITECLDIIEQAKHRAGDAFRQSDFLDKASRNLRERGEPATGRVLEDEIERVRRKFVEVQLAALGQERAQFWGWPNTYTYTKSIGEQIVAASGLGFCIVRPAIIESCVSFPRQGWNEGINTSAPLIYAIREGLAQLPGGPVRLDVVPCDMVAAGMTLALAELVGGEAKPVYQFGTSDSNPITMARIYELSGLYKRKYHLSAATRGAAAVHFLQAHVEGALLSPEAFARFGPKAIARGATTVANACTQLPEGALHTLLEPIAKGLHQFSRTQQKIAEVVVQFQPFTAELDYEFRCDNTRAALARVVESERADMCWCPEQLDWRDWFLGTHVAGLEQWVFPELEQKLKKRLKSLRRHETLVQLLAEMATRFELTVALQQEQTDGLTRVSFREWEERATACAVRLQAAGVKPGDRVVLSGTPRPEWAIGLFGIVKAGAVATFCSSTATPEALTELVTRVQAKWALVDGDRLPRFNALGVQDCWEIEAHTQVGPLKGLAVELPQVTGLDAAVLFASDTGDVSFTHAHLTGALASLAPVYPLRSTDRVLAMPMSHAAVELSCGLLLPLSRGARVIYPAQGGFDGSLSALERGRVSVVVGDAPSWELLAQHIRAQVLGAGKLKSLLSKRSLKVNRALGKQTGLDVGRFLFSEVHQALGGHLRLLIGAGGRTSDETRRWLAGVGLLLSEGLAIREAAGPLSAVPVQVGGRSGHLGRALPDVELRIESADPEGFGEIWARGPMLSVGTTELRAGTLDSRQAWFPTGKRGRLDEAGRLWLGSETSGGAAERSASHAAGRRLGGTKSNKNKGLGADSENHPAVPERARRRPISAVVARLFKGKPQARVH